MRRQTTFNSHRIQVHVVKCGGCGQSVDREESYDMDHFILPVGTTHANGTDARTGHACLSCGRKVIEAVIGGPIPHAAKRDSRICFGIAFFKTEEEADRYAKFMGVSGRTYNGGYFHGTSCGREKDRDIVDAELGQLYAVTE